jgi:hypothetical protein
MDSPALGTGKPGFAPGLAALKKKRQLAPAQKMATQKSAAPAHPVNQADKVRQPMGVELEKLDAVETSVPAPLLQRRNARPAAHDEAVQAGMASIAPK